ncbi:MAG TPA: NADH-quinone oxidoreductase subunit H [candidate division WOR-3 bacterium]|uniref:NADH-quinone oxidoreductase subunit H n=1 Tax=candidate division WOR-3 bacterium TaxID=2052148 RepID=A0A9C9ELK2_UNCW3|nr:NADH-quinone oxidoreductase subunit H [candidate division WOR-3 bacterium]
MNIVRFLFSYIIFPGFLFSAVIGLFVTWIDRKVTARIHWRVGPPWFQPYADFLKLLLKETIVPEGASKILFLSAPLLGIISMSVLAVMLFSMNFDPTRTFVGDLIVIIYLLALPALGIIVGGSASKNPLASVGVSREMTQYFAYELPFLIAMAIVVIKSGGSIKFGEIVAAQQAHGPFLYSISGIIAGVVILLSTQAKLSFVPFDIPEAEQEIMAGPYIEYSGVALAMYKLARAMMFFLLPLFLISVLWGGFADWWAILKFLVIVVLIVLIKNTNPRLRIDQALKFFWLGIGILSIIGLIFAFYGL